MPSLGASDAHVIDRIGKYATKFYDTIRDDKDFIEAVKSKNFHPVMRRYGTFTDFDYSYEELLPKERIPNLKSK